MSQPQASNSAVMTQDELRHELKGSLLVLSTSSPDKRDIYRLMFSSYNKGIDHHAGLDCYFTDSGALGITPRKTPEKTGAYAGNLDEKAKQLLDVLSDRGTQENIRLKLPRELGNQFNPERINIVGMTEDSGWQLTFDDDDTKRKFLDKIAEKVSPHLRGRDKWLLDNLQQSGFPGPNLKPFQEHLEGGFDALMKLIYDTAEEIGVKQLRYSSTANVSFVSPRTGKHFEKSFEACGRLLTRDEYRERLLDQQHGEAINSNFVHVPDGQNNIKGSSAHDCTYDMLIKDGLYTKSSEELPAQFVRREITEWLQDLIGKRRSTHEERKHPVKIGVVSAGQENGGHSIPSVNDYMHVSVPSHKHLMRHANAAVLGDADVVVLAPTRFKPNDKRLYHDPNLSLLLKFIVTVETDPASMRVPIILDNRSAGFDKSLEIISDAFAQGRIMGERPYAVANTDDELRAALNLFKDVHQRAPKIKSLDLSEGMMVHSGELQKAPADKTFTVFIGGGHANNNKKDLGDAKQLGYFCAKNNWRIVTGAGSVEGSMGAVHTGYIQYHLDKLKERTDDVAESFKRELSQFIDTKAEGKIDAERVILSRPDIIEKMANQGFIQRDKFFGYSMQPLLDMESPTKSHPPGITYFESGNRARRLAALLAPGTKVFLPGSIGTDEEFVDTIKQHIDASARGASAANQSFFADGTPDGDGTMIIYNRGNNLDKLLSHHHLLGGDPVSRVKRDKYNIRIVSNLDELKESLSTRASKWVDRVANTVESTAEVAPQSQARA